MVDRSRSVVGPYLDKNGKAMTEGRGSALLVGNSRWLGPGGESILRGQDGDIIVLHAYVGATARP